LQKSKSPNVYSYRVLVSVLKAGLLVFVFRQARFLFSERSKFLNKRLEAIFNEPIKGNFSGPRDIESVSKNQTTKKTPMRQTWPQLEISKDKRGDRYFSVVYKSGLKTFCGYDRAEAVKLINADGDEHARIYNEFRHTKYAKKASSSEDAADVGSIADVDSIAEDEALDSQATDETPQD
jgi:hypothetical protein